MNKDIEVFALKIGRIWVDEAFNGMEVIRINLLYDDGGTKKSLLIFGNVDPSLDSGTALLFVNPTFNLNSDDLLLNIGWCCNKLMAAAKDNCESAALIGFGMYGSQSIMSRYIQKKSRKKVNHYLQHSLR